MNNSNSPQVGILMGSDSDWPTMKSAADAHLKKELEKFKVRLMEESRAKNKTPTQ